MRRTRVRDCSEKPTALKKNNKKRLKFIRARTCSVKPDPRSFIGGNAQIDFFGITLQRSPLNRFYVGLHRFIRGLHRLKDVRICRCGDDFRWDYTNYRGITLQRSPLGRFFDGIMSSRQNLFIQFVPRDFGQIRFIHVLFIF
jgi:hypothetical protein